MKTHMLPSKPLQVMQKYRENNTSGSNVASKRNDNQDFPSRFTQRDQGSYPEVIFHIVL